MNSEVVIENNELANINSQGLKYIALTKLLKSIYQNSFNKTITCPEEFIDVDREQIIKKENHDYLLSIEKELFRKGAFSKTAVVWSRRKIADNYIMAFLRYACPLAGYSFNYSKKPVYERINNMPYTRTSYQYTIKKIV
ncbi:MAG: hypothetical protein Hyperionvirus39_8 [Hyperionvirus sp.]|uniref:Uncharacterized protein n=1 Tax=Hyperionvirus sp. TaxID=2487770 RepID=A0A3G5AC07_9VIRU|nr:MAG: hypothetical protein Hyperionvirus39_8 [Hyperionvirus sp.]